MIIFQNEDFYIEEESHELPWVKIFTKHPYKELSELPNELRTKLWDIYTVVEQTMIEHFKPDKINMASFGNILPRVHIHVIARFADDAYFPNPVWGEKLRETKPISKEFKPFYEKIAKTLEEKQ